MVNPNNNLDKLVLLLLYNTEHMETRNISHRYGSLNYLFNNEIAWTETDQQMADGVAHCILVTERNLDEADALFKRSSELRKSIEAMNEAHKAVGGKLKMAQDLAGGYVGALELGQYSIADMLSEAVNTANEAIQTQNAEIRELHAVYTALLDDHKAIVDREESEDIAIYDNLNSLFLLGYEAKDLATDLESFDRAIEMLRAVLSNNDRTQENKMNYVVEITRDYELLQARIEGQQFVWEEFCARLVLIEYIGKLRSGTQSSSFN